MESKLRVSQVINKMRNSLWAILITDALCMPVHWYYDLRALERDFGYLTSYADPKDTHPTTTAKMLLKESTDPTVDIIGKKILHNKRDLYKKKGTHYHAGLKAGDVTMNSDVLKLTMESIIKSKDKKESYDPDIFLEDYINFHLTPGTHNDTYIDTCHFNFVTNYLRGKTLRKCAAEENHDSPAALAMKLVTPALFAPVLDYFREKKLSLDDEVEVPKEVFEKSISSSLTHLGLLFSGKPINKHTDSYSRTLLNVILGKDLQKAIEEDGDQAYGVDFPNLVKEAKDDLTVATRRFTIACYTDGSVPLAYYLAYKYNSDFDKAIIVNCNLGGENISRGAMVGSLVAASLECIKEKNTWVEGITRKEEFSKTIEEFLKL